MNYYLYAAYAATWVIHIAYLSMVSRRYARLRREAELQMSGVPETAKAYAHNRSAVAAVPKSEGTVTKNALPDEFLKLVDALLHQYEADYKSQEFFHSIGCLFEFARKRGFSGTRELLQFLQDNSAGAVSRLGLRYEVSQYVPFFEKVIMERNPALRLHDDVRRSGGTVAFTAFSRDWLQDLVRTIEYHGLHWDPVSGRIL